MTQDQVIHGLLDEQNGQYQSNRKLLEKLIRTFQVGRLRINGLPPDANYSLVDYLFDSEYFLIDSSRLSSEAKDKFHSWLIADHQAQKSHLYQGSSTTNEYRGFTAQTFLSWWGRLKSWLLNRKPDYWTLDDLNLTLDYQLLGLEISQGKNGYLVGFNQIQTPKLAGKYKPEIDDQQEPLGNVKRIYLLILWLTY